MAKLMHDNVIDERGWKLEKPIIEIEIASRRAATPPPALVANYDAIDRALIRLIEVRNARDDERMRFLLSSWRIAHPLILPYERGGELI